MDAKFPEDFRKRLPIDEYEELQREILKRARVLIPYCQKINGLMKSPSLKKKDQELIKSLLASNPEQPPFGLEIEGVRYQLGPFRKNGFQEGDDIGLVAWSKIEKLGVPVFVPLVIYSGGNFKVYFKGLTRHYPQYKRGMKGDELNLAHLNNFVNDLVERARNNPPPEPVAFFM